MSQWACRSVISTSNLGSTFTQTISQFHSATKHGKDNTEYGQESATNNKSENKQQPQ